jgi:hypothetical protein
MAQAPEGSKVSTGAGKRSAKAAPVKATEAFSFLKETRMRDSWSLRDLENCLRVSSAEAHEIVSMFKLQGYVKKHGREWTTTQDGYTVSGSAMPHYTRATIERALARLKDHIEEANKDPSAPYRVVKAVAFGDFLDKSATRAQPANVGIQLEARENKVAGESSVERKTEDAFLMHLRKSMGMVHLQHYEDWMGRRSHLRLL